MGIDDLINKGKEALKNEEQTDAVLDKAADFAKDKFASQSDKIDQVRDAIDAKIGDEGSKA